MTAPAEPPRYVYKIVDTEPPFPIPEVFPPSELDKKDGFIHLSAPWQPPRLKIDLDHPARPRHLRAVPSLITANQLPITADLFFGEHTTLWILKIRLASIGSAVRWESPPNASERYPHLYGSLGRADVESVERFKRTADERGVFQGRWKDVFSDSRWRAWEEGKGMAVEE